MGEYLEQNGVDFQLICIDGRPTFPSCYPDLDMELEMEQQTTASIASNFLQIFGVPNDELDLDGNATEDEIISKATEVANAQGYYPTVLVRVAIVRRPCKSAVRIQSN